MLWGNNPTATWLARSVELQKALRRGAKLIVVDPRPTTFARRADCWLRIKPGTDQALALGLANLMIQEQMFDAAFIKQWSNGPFLVRSDTGTFLRQSDLNADGDRNILLALATDRSTLLRYDAAKGTWLDDHGRAELDAQYTIAGPDRAIACRSAFGIFSDAAAEFPPDRVEEITSIPQDTLRQAARLLATCASAAYYAWNGVGQSTAATHR